MLKMSKCFVCVTVSIIISYYSLSRNALLLFTLQIRRTTLARR